MPPGGSFSSPSDLRFCPMACHFPMLGWYPLSFTIACPCRLAWWRKKPLHLFRTNEIWCLLLMRINYWRWLRMPIPNSVRNLTPLSLTFPNSWRHARTRDTNGCWQSRNPEQRSLSCTEQWNSPGHRRAFGVVVVVFGLWSEAYAPLIPNFSIISIMV